jgi:hypothetical protein
MDRLQSFCGKEPPGEQSCRVVNRLKTPGGKETTIYSPLLLYPLKYGKPEHHLSSAAYVIKLLVVPCCWV